MSKASNFHYWKKSPHKTKMVLWVRFGPRAQKGSVAHGKEGCPGVSEGESRALGGPCVQAPAATRPLGSKPHSLSTPCDTLLCHDCRPPPPQTTFTAAGEIAKTVCVSFSSLHRPGSLRMKPVFRGASCSHKQRLRVDRVCSRR